MAAEAPLSLNAIGPGNNLGRFEIVSRVATGSTSEIFFAKQRGSGGFEKIVALKTILPHLADHPGVVRMMSTEARIASLLSHQNLVPVFDFGEDRGRFFLAMEFVAGVKATELLAAQSGGGIPTDVAARITADVALGLHAMHQLNVLHRDACLSNVMITYDGYVKLIDLGTAAEATGRAETEIRGRLGYTAPELLDGAPADRRSEVFSLGVVLWELLTGRPLFSRSDDESTIRAVQQGAIHAPSGNAQWTRLDEITMRALDRNPALRFHSAQQMHDALCSTLDPVHTMRLRGDIRAMMQASFSAEIREHETRLRSAHGEEPGASPISLSSPFYDSQLVRTSVIETAPASQMMAASGLQEASLRPKAEPVEAKILRAAKAREANRAKQAEPRLAARMPKQDDLRPEAQWEPPPAKPFGVTRLLMILAVPLLVWAGWTVFAGQDSEMASAADELLAGGQASKSSTSDEGVAPSAGKAVAAEETKVVAAEPTTKESDPTDVELPNEPAPVSPEATDDKTDQPAPRTRAVRGEDAGKKKSEELRRAAKTSPRAKKRRPRRTSRSRPKATRKRAAKKKAALLPSRRRVRSAKKTRPKKTRAKKKTRRSARPMEDDL